MINLNHTMFFFSSKNSPFQKNIHTTTPKAAIHKLMQHLKKNPSKNATQQMNGKWIHLVGKHCRMLSILSLLLVLSLDVL